MVAYIPYENHNVTEHSRVYLYFHPKKDLVGIKLRVIRGVYDVSARPPMKFKGPGLSDINLFGPFGSTIPFGTLIKNVFHH